MKTNIKFGMLLCGAVSLSTLAFAKNVYPVQSSANTAVHLQADDLKPQDIIDKYIQAVGGKDNIDKVKTIYSKGTVSIQELSLSFETKKMNPNKFLIDVTMDGQDVSKEVFDGVAGYKEQSGTRTDYTPDAIKQTADNKSLFPQEYYAGGGYTLALKGTANVNSKPAYVIDVTSPSGGKATEYYDSVSYLLLRADVTIDGNTTVYFFDNYKAVDNVLLPYKMAENLNTNNGEMEVDIVVDTYAVNGNDVSDADFK